MAVSGWFARTTRSGTEWDVVSPSNEGSNQEMNAISGGDEYIVDNVGALCTHAGSE